MKINVLLFTCAPVCFESFRRVLNEIKAVYIAEYYLVCRFSNYDAPITSQVSINVVVNLRRNRSVIITKAADEIIFGNVNRLCFIQNPSKRLKKDTGTRVNNSTFIFIDIKRLGALCKR